jgi:hypothetical protein
LLGRCTQKLQRDGKIAAAIGRICCLPILLRPGNDVAGMCNPDEHEKPKNRAFHSRPFFVEVAVANVARARSEFRN